MAAEDSAAGFSTTDMGVPGGASPLGLPIVESAADIVGIVKGIHPWRDASVSFDRHMGALLVAVQVCAGGVSDRIDRENDKMPELINHDIKKKLIEALVRKFGARIMGWAAMKFPGASGARFVVAIAPWGVTQAAPSIILIGAIEGEPSPFPIKLSVTYERRNGTQLGDPGDVLAGMVASLADGILKVHVLVPDDHIVKEDAVFVRRHSVTVRITYNTDGSAGVTVQIGGIVTLTDLAMRERVAIPGVTLDNWLFSADEGEVVFGFIIDTEHAREYIGSTAMSKKRQRDVDDMPAAKRARTDE